jgi:hypothetical protein
MVKDSFMPKEPNDRHWGGGGAHLFHNETRATTRMSRCWVRLRFTVCWQRGANVRRPTTRGKTRTSSFLLFPLRFGAFVLRAGDGAALASS